MARAITRIELSKKKKRVFLDTLAKTGRVTESARSVGYTTTQHLHKMRREDEDFAEQWDLAVAAAKDVLEAEAIRRAHDGVLEPTYHKGEIVGYTTKYSDALLMFVLKKLDPEYRDTGRSGSTNINFGVAFLPIQAKDADAWESRSLDMHRDQTVITLEAKPIENNMVRIKTERSD